MIDQACKALPSIERQLRPASREMVAKWLGSLGLLCSGQMTANDAKIKIAAYLPNIDAPEMAFTPETLKAAGQKFTWFPAYAEVNAFLDEQCLDLRKIRMRLMELAKAKPTEQVQTGWAFLTDEQKAAHQALMDRARANLSLA